MLNLHNAEFLRSAVDVYKRQIYGHLHSESLRYAVEGVHEGIEWRLVSGDHVDFTPIFLKK